MSDHSKVATEATINSLVETNTSISETAEVAAEATIDSFVETNTSISETATNDVVDKKDSTSETAEKDTCPGGGAVKYNHAASEAIDAPLGPSVTATDTSTSASTSTAVTSFNIVETVHLSTFDIAAMFYQHYGYIPFEVDDDDQQNDV